MALPAGVGSCRIDWRVITATVDGGDDGRQPDGVPLVGATITLRASVQYVLAASATPPTTIICAPVLCSLDDDGRIHLTDAGTPAAGEDEYGVYIVATDDADISPTGWTWTATIEHPSIRSIVTPPFNAPTGGHVDLTTVLPTTDVPGATNITVTIPAASGPGKVLTSTAADGVLVWTPVSTSATGGSLAQRTPSGTLVAAPAQESGELVTLGQIDALSGAYVAQISGLLTAGTQLAGAANVATINAQITATAASGGGEVVIAQPGTYYVDGTIVLKSHITFRICPGVRLKRVDNGIPVCMIRNEHVSDVAPYADGDIAVVGGGIIDGNAANNTTRPYYSYPSTPALGSLEYGIVGDVAFIGVSRLSVRDIHSEGGKGSCIQVLGTDIAVERYTFGTPGDGLHINGPSARITLRDVSGYATDDFIALLPWDWRRTGPSVGDITDVLIEQCTYHGAGSYGGTGSAALKMVPGTRASGYGAGVGKLRNVTVIGLNIFGGAGIVAESEFDQITGEHSGAGTISNVRFIGGTWIASSAAPVLVFQKLSIGGTPADGQTSLAVCGFTVQGVHFRCDVSATPGAVRFDYPYTGLSVQGFKVQDCIWTPWASGSAFLNVVSKSAVDTVEIDGLTVMANMSSGAAVATVNDTASGATTTVRRMALRGLETAPGVTIDSPVVAVSGIIGKLIGADWNLAFTGGAGDNHGVVFTNAHAVLSDADLSGLTLTGAKTLFRVGAGATGSVICKAVVSNSNIAATHPIFITGSRQADIAFRGGNIDTAGNLARVDASTLHLTLDGTTSSGVGATTITLVSSPTVRVRKSDRIALPLNTLALTPGDGDAVYSSGTPSSVVFGSGAGLYVYRGGAGWVKLN